MGVCLRRVKNHGGISGELDDSKLFDWGNVLSAIKKYILENKEVIVLLVLLGGFFFSNLGAYKMFMWDEAEYASIARSVLRGDGYALNGAAQTGRLPVYPLSVAVAFALFGVSYETTKISGIMFALLSIFAVYFFVRKYADKKTALVCGVLLASTPVFFTLALNTLTDITYSALFFLSAMFFFVGVNENTKYFYVAGSLLGLSFLTRYNAVLFAVMAAVYLAYLWVGSRRKVSCLFKSKHVYLSLILFLVVLAPWMIYVQGETGNAIGGILDAQNRISTYSVASFPWYYYLNLGYSVLGITVFLMFVLGVGYVVYKREDFGVYCLIILLVNFLYFSQFGWKEERMMVSWVPFMVVLSGMGLMKVVYPWLKRDLKSEHLSLGACALVLLVSVYFNYSGVIAPKLERSTAIGYPSLIQASSFVEAESLVGESIVGASIPQYYWYANRFVRGYPRDAEGFVDLLEGGGISFVLIGNYERNQPQYVVSMFSQAFLDEGGRFRNPDDEQKIRIFGNVAHFNDPMSYPVTIVVPSDLFVERVRDFAG